MTSSSGNVPVSAQPTGAQTGAPAEFPPASPGQQGLFGVRGSGDTSGFGGLVRKEPAIVGTERPYGSYFDEVVDALQDGLDNAGPPGPTGPGAGASDDDGEPGPANGHAAPARAFSFADSVEAVVVDRGELTMHIRPARIAEVCQVLRDDPALRFELCSSVSGVDYLGTDERRLHVVYQLTSMTYRRRIRLEAAVSVEAPELPSVTAVYPTADWQEREAYDMFGVVFAGHPGLTRILMPDDWEGHPQRKDYPLGGVPVEYKGAEIPPPDQRRSYQ